MPYWWSRVWLLCTPLLFGQQLQLVRYACCLLCRGAYKLSQTFPARTFFSGDLGKSLQVQWAVGGSGGQRYKVQGDSLPDAGAIQFSSHSDGLCNGVIARLCIRPSLQDLGFEARTALQLELLPPAAKRSKFTVAPPPPAAAQPGAVISQVAQAPPPPPPGGFALQLKLFNGEALRGSFPPEAVLQEVAHYVDTHRTGEGWL